MKNVLPPTLSLLGVAIIVAGLFLTIFARHPHGRPVVEVLGMADISQVMGFSFGPCVMQVGGLVALVGFALGSFWHQDVTPQLESSP